MVQCVIEMPVGAPPDVPVGDFLHGGNFGLTWSGGDGFAAFFFNEKPPVVNGSGGRGVNLKATGGGCCDTGRAASMFPSWQLRNSNQKTLGLVPWGGGPLRHNARRFQWTPKGLQDAFRRSQPGASESPGRGGLGVAGFGAAGFGMEGSGGGGRHRQPKKT